jgi:hypothetical protein
MPARPILLALTAVAAAWIIWTMLGPGRRPDGWKTTALALCLATLGYHGWMEYRWQQTEHTMTAAAALIAGPDATVHCQRFTEALLYTRNARGLVEYGQTGPTREALITWETCQAFRDWLTSDKTNPTDAQILAVHILTHEAAHLRGERNEAAAECDAMQWMPLIAEHLGAPRQATARMSAWYLTAMYPRMPTAYQSGNCQPNGTLDLHPGTPGWPRADTLPPTPTR